MQIVETLNEGLKRAYTLTVTTKDIDARVDAEIKTLASQVRMPGFRPGKVPPNLVRKMHGQALQREALDKSVREGVDRNGQPYKPPMAYAFYKTIGVNCCNGYIR